ncbi:hypothetical protein HHL16_02970 [Pseudoflavitalea sp. G-6-1-2]|uniref:RDD family protein n=1 Tax=Pseudoflavitalea sp. G-6-1-2 TaxID=2728841 RepID=UPI00146D66A5|nr:RDD family protein [Pseudoflavitalea sp. G-6-1-2]NML19815.1 hypothetical protein [Pseudoflavitalea sp. G-6-1-2]
MNRTKTITLALITILPIAQYSVSDNTLITELIKLAFSPGSNLFYFTSLLSFFLDLITVSITSLLPIIYFATKKNDKKDRLYALIRYMVIIRYIFIAPMFLLFQFGQEDQNLSLSDYASWVGIFGFLIFCMILWNIKPASEKHKVNLSDYLSVSYASKSSRFMHLLIDSIFFLCICPIWNIFFNPDEGISHTKWYITFIILFVTYYWLSEAMFRSTLGKYITGTMVAGTNQPMQPKLAFSRSICRLIPLEAISFLTGRDWHDKFTSTAVVHVNSLQTNIFESETAPTTGEFNQTSGTNQ